MWAEIEDDDHKARLAHVNTVQEKRKVQNVCSFNGRKFMT